MASYTSALRAVGSVYAQRVIRTAGFIGLGIFIVLIIATYLLAQQVSSYWWLSLIFILPMSLVGFAVFALAYGVARTIYNRPLNPKQKKLVSQYVKRIESVMETTQLSFVFIIYTMAKDLLLHRELRTLQGFIGNSSSLKRDLDHLAKQF